MKTIITLIAATVLTMSTACSAEPGKDAAKPAEAPKTTEAPKTKQVCLDVVQNGKPVKNKDGSTKQNCRTVKVHKKHEGTKIDGAKKSK